MQVKTLTLWPVVRRKTKNIDMFHLKYHPLKKKKKSPEEEVGKEGPGEKRETSKWNQVLSC